MTTLSLYGRKPPVNSDPSPDAPQPEAVHAGAAVPASRVRRPRTDAETAERTRRRITGLLARAKGFEAAHLNSVALLAGAERSIENALLTAADEIELRAALARLLADLRMARGAPAEVQP